MYNNEDEFDNWDVDPSEYLMEDTAGWSDEHASPVDHEGWMSDHDVLLEQPTLMRQYSEHILSLEDLQARQHTAISTITEQCYISYDEAAVLIRKFQWDSQALLERWLMDSDNVRQQFGLLEQKSNVPDTDPFFCTLCTESVPLSASTRLGCGHRYCDNCWAQWLEAETDKGPSAIFTTCIAFRCSQVVPESLHLKLLNERKRSLFIHWTLAAFIQGSPFLRWCPASGCNRAVEYKLGGVKEVNCLCGSFFCFKCGKEGHRPASCAIVEQWLLKNSTDSENANWMLANTKICPKCQVRIEKNQGCNHMTCRHCAHEFCWLCKGNWKDHGTATGGFYKCNRYEADPKTTAAANEELKAEEARTALQKYLFYFTRYDNHDKSIRFAQETRRKAEETMSKLQDKLGTNYQDVQFVLKAVEAVIACRRVLKWTYCYGFYLEGDGVGSPKEMFESHQERLEKFTEHLHGLTERSIEELLDNRVRMEIVNYTRVVEKYRQNVIEHIEGDLPR